MRKILFLLLFFAIQFAVYAQENHDEGRYVPDPDPLVQAKVSQWQDLKFGLFMHWGTYSQWGIVESWSICPEEYGWCERTVGANPDNYFLYKKEYEGLKNTFNPVKFHPEDWVRAAQYAGMKYMVFTTKHHDGFCMYDSKYTDYKITDADCPFSSNDRSDLTKEIFNSFREKDFWVGAYFSKADWHTPYYWDPKFPPRDRNVNYEPEAYPENWQKFTEFTHNQILELMSNYGNVDILWLDGGWVSKKSKKEIVDLYQQELAKNENLYLKTRIINQDIHMDELVDKAREKQPGLIVVDRAVHGKNQNYLTPENRVPERELPYPWESCIISGGGWSHTKNAKYMSGRAGVHLLIDIVAKGGNLLLNIAPTPQGEWQQGAYDLLQEYGDWMAVNDEGIYNSRTLPPYKENNICMTQQKNGNAYFFYLCDEEEETMPATITVESHRPSKNAKVHLLGVRKALQWQAAEKGFVVNIPEKLQKNPPCRHAWVIKVSELE